MNERNFPIILIVLIGFVLLMLQFEIDDLKWESETLYQRVEQLEKR
jgi:hypothetical protein